MGLREFVDSEGLRWRVWDTAPERYSGLATEYQRGWLTFDNGTDRFRLAPIPPDWESLPDARLALLIRMAEPPRQNGPTALWNGEERRVADRRRGDRRASAHRLPPVQMDSPRSTDHTRP